ncbi:hypothetical protein PGTUg99_020111 [Puccinia graminis f. sp. tritici]|uniref:Uncharacterized protein n=1 Tax=Puccinia graminis f. sp. tritici TaxID=56615 RepID=A0A5B0SHN5_PUCGR|nr:hypothetical protein PGTUg99_020111 [Puccinia graminis f. sp. tritici]
MAVRRLARLSYNTPAPQYQGTRVIASSQQESDSQFFGRFTRQPIRWVPTVAESEEEGASQFGLYAY